MKGIILAGGKGTRLFPSTKIISKQLIPVYDKPMIYYPLSTLMEAGIREILIISDNHNLKFYKELFGDGKELGLSLKYKVQKEPKGIAEAFLIGEEFIGKDNVALILGDNIFYGQELSKTLLEASKIRKGALIFGYWVANPQDYGVIEINENGEILSIEEKPQTPKSNYAIPGIYFYDNNVIELAKKLTPSKRGELEITDLHKEYLKKKQLKVKLLGRGVAWLDSGTHDNLLEASMFIKTIEKRQGLKIGCIEETAYKMGFITKEQLKKLANNLPVNSYSNYIKRILNIN